MSFDKTNNQNLSDVITALKDHNDLTDNQRRDRISAANRIAKFLNRSPADLPTDAPLLRKMLTTIHPTQSGISAKSLTNVVSDLTKALQSTGHLPHADPKIEPSEERLEYLSPNAQTYQRFSLARFVTFCCHRNIVPNDVSDAVLASFQSYLNTRLLGKDPSKLCKEVAQVWNRIGKTNELDLCRLTYSRSSYQHRCRPISDYPKSLQIEIASYLNVLAHSDIFDENGPDKPLRPTSLRNSQAHFRQYLDALTFAGEDPCSFTSLKTVVTSDKMKRAFMSIMERRSVNSVPSGLHNIAATLSAVAKHHLNLPTAELDAIRKIKKKVAPDPHGMSSKNRERLLQFNDWENVVRLISFPNVQMDFANSKPTTSSAALAAMSAVAVTILLSCPMRVKNLASLDLERHLIAQRNGTHTIYSIRIEGSEVKNGAPIEVALNAQSSQLLHRYIKVFRPMISKARGTALFPKATDGKARTPDNFSNGIKSCIYRETGLTVHTHLFRHFAAYLYLKERPGDFETVRRILKHRTLQTTMDFYA